MSSILYYCNVCGKILDREDVYQVLSRDWETRKRKKLFDICEGCLVNLERRRFSMPHIKDHKHIKFMSILKRHLASGKSKLMYDVLPDQFEKIMSLKRPKDDLVLKTKFDKRYWTEGAMRNSLEHSDEELMKAVIKLYGYQTADEKKGRETIHDNAVGFNKPDAAYLTGMARLYETKGLKGMTERQIARTRKLMMKYVAQLTIIANA